jgi:Zn-dependent peptidase ImmA (M78 family)
MISGTSYYDLCALDFQLETAPLPIRRFTQRMMVGHPTLAMKCATDRALQEYGQAEKQESSPISITKLCELFGIKLVGNRPSYSRAWYSIENYKPRNGHTGRLFFEAEKPFIKIANSVSYDTARISAAHEIGHLLIHRSGARYDEATLRLPSTPAEEALAEYGARLLLFPICKPSNSSNLAEYALMHGSKSRVTLHAAVSRLTDPDVTSVNIKGAILWRLNGRIEKAEPINARLTPQWHLCARHFVPVGKCKARQRSLVADLAESNKPAAGSRVEDVSIGSFTGRFRVDACAWGSVDEGTRLVLSVFRNPYSSGAQGAFDFDEVS